MASSGPGLGETAPQPPGQDVELVDFGTPDDHGSGTSDTDDDFFHPAGDGAVDRMWRSRQKSTPVAAIFIHAGAGYHSTANEKLHLEVCNEAARLAMKFLREGASAVDAVEAAIRCLEDREITNAGYGSNLSIDGMVECDATVVDHLGRSGACGAVPNIKNPISLARMILDMSGRPLSLRRVAPNILVGPGAKEFASEHGIPVLPNELLVSRNAQDRFLRWSDDLRRAENKGTPPQSPENDEAAADSPDIEKELQKAHAADTRDHPAAIFAGTWNEGQPDSPSHGPATPESNSPSASPSRQWSPATSTPASPEKTPGRGPLAFMMMAGQPSANPRGSKKARGNPTSNGNAIPLSSPPAAAAAGTRGGGPGVSGRDEGFATMAADDEPWGMEPSCGGRISSRSLDSANQPSRLESDDTVNDTVGAIAIDLAGNVAAGSSSGGIGMKHSGRIGPAALVGVGTAVLPADPDDVDFTSVACVTSGTGEHMATTMASHKCADRLYYNCKRGPGGRQITEYDEDALMESFIAEDFMNHPGVRSQNSAGAIGVMAVKKTRGGYYFYFAHNTDSFAVASMASTEKEPLLVMSRLGETQDIARGGRKIRLN